jgi:hypothetical protein
MLVAYSIKLAMVIFLYIHMALFNQKRDKEQETANARVGEKQAIEMGMHDVTEIDNQGFRYIL